METNLLAVDNSATPDIKNSQVGANMIDAEYLFDDERRRPDVDLLTCLSLKTGMSKTTILFLFGVVIFATVWYCVASVVSSNKPKNITLPTEVSFPQFSSTSYFWTDLMHHQYQLLLFLIITIQFIAHFVTK